MWLLESRYVRYNPIKIPYKHAVKLALESMNGHGSPQAQDLCLRKPIVTVNLKRVCPTG